MIDFSNLPKDPVSALDQVLLDALSMLPANNMKISDIIRQTQPKYDRLVIQLRSALAIATRIGDDEVAELLKRNLYVRRDEGTVDVRNRIQTAINSLVVFKLDRHFIGSDDVGEFDEASVPPAERDDIRACLQNARDLAAKAGFLSDPVRRSFLHKVSLAENELFKEKVGFQAFLAVAYEGSRLLRRYGEDAQPLADAIEKARTKTEAHVSGYKQIEATKKPKQITKQ